MFFALPERPKQNRFLMENVPSALVQEEPPCGYLSLDLGITHPSFILVGNSMVCFYRRAVMIKGVTAPFYHVPNEISLPCYKVGSQVQCCAAHPFQIFPVSAGLHLPCRV